MQENFVFKTKLVTNQDYNHDLWNINLMFFEALQKAKKIRTKKSNQTKTSTKSSPKTGLGDGMDFKKDWIQTY